MAIPIILGIAAGIAAAAGVGSGIAGGVKMKEANDTMESSKRRHQKNLERFDEQNKLATKHMDEIGEFELKILKSFETFADVMSKIQNKPSFKEIDNKFNLPTFTHEELKEASVGAGVLLGGLGGAALGTAGGIAAGGATTAAVFALGTASTGTAIASLSGVAATNATLAALGGGALAAGGGGMALGSAILGGATLGVGLLIGGVIFRITGHKLSEKADEAWRQMKRAEEEIDKICAYLLELRVEAGKFYDALQKVYNSYQSHLTHLSNMVYVFHKNDWNEFTDEEQTVGENTIMLVNLLYHMCKTPMVIQAKREGELNTVNKTELKSEIDKAIGVLEIVA
jgi:uncharacterized membrane-anchored protein YhcB (DUF1043 family)